MGVQHAGRHVDLDAGDVDLDDQAVV